MLNKKYLHHVTEFAVGLLFGLGLMLSGMTDPGKVIGFLDLFGSWDPSLALVMGGAIMVGIFAFTIAKNARLLSWAACCVSLLMQTSTKSW